MVGDVNLGIEHLKDITIIGRGGFSVVYAATDVRFDRRVAVKVLNKLVDESDRRRFDRECRVMGRLSSHPNVATVFDAGYTPDTSPYLIMELVEGGTLADHLDRHGPMSWTLAADLVIQVCGALARAHAENILHRDVKPENILLADGVPLLTDFGIAYLRDSTGATSTKLSASWLHTPPETFENRRDERADLYSAGSTLYQLIVGSPPFWREGDESLSPLMMRLVTEPPPALPAELGPPALAEFLTRTLAKDPDDRPQTASQFAAELSAIRNEAAADFAGSESGLGSVAPSVSVTDHAEHDEADPSTDLNDAVVADQPPVDLPSASDRQSFEPSGQGQQRRRPVVVIAALAAIAAVVVAGVVIAVRGNDDGGKTPLATVEAAGDDTGPGAGAGEVEGVDPVAPVGGDGVLRAATLFPLSGELAFLSPAMLAGVELAMTDVNAAGGVFGQEMTLEGEDSGGSPEQAGVSVDRLLDGEVDVIVDQFLPYRLDQESLEAEVLALVTAGSDVIVLIGGDESAQILALMHDNGIGPTSTTDVWGVDRNVGIGAQLDLAILKGMRHTNHAMESGSNPDFNVRLEERLGPDSLLAFGAESYDAIVIVALAAVLAGSDDPIAIAAEINGVTAGGTKCDSFEACRQLIEDGGDPDYEGVGGPYEFSPEGEPTVAHFLIQTWGPDGLDPGLDELVLCC